MKQWTDYRYVVTHRRMKNGGEIDSLRVTTYNRQTTNLDPYADMTKTDLAALLPNDRKAITATRNSRNLYEMGAEICVIRPRNGRVYLRTRADSVEADNLDHLPLF